MGLVTSCCKTSHEDPDERVPLKTNKGGNGGIIIPNFSTKDPSDDFIVDPAIKQFLENFSSDDDATNGNDAIFDELVKQQD